MPTSAALKPADDLDRDLAGTLRLGLNRRRRRRNLRILRRRQIAERLRRGSLVRRRRLQVTLGAMFLWTSEHHAKTRTPRLLRRHSVPKVDGAAAVAFLLLIAYIIRPRRG